MIFSTTIANTLKATLEKTIDDPKGKPKTVYGSFCMEKTQSDAYEDILETAGPGLASEVGEGEELSLGSIREGYITRFLARKFGLRMAVTKETMEDCKYKEVIQLGQRLTRALWKTVDYDAVSMLVRAFNAAYTHGDGLPLISTAHTLAHGGTYSNAFATPVSPSVTAVESAQTQAMLLPGHDGLTEGYTLQKVIFPVAQWGDWARITKSTKQPDDDTNAINVVNSEMSLQLVPVKYWQNTTTNYIFQTDAGDGMQIRWRRKPATNTWVENSNEVMYHSISARWSRGWVDPRAYIGVEA